MKSLVRVLLFVFAGIGVLYVAILLFATIGSRTKYVCNTLNLRTLPSPGGGYVAYETQNRCGDKKIETVVWVGKVNSNQKWSAFSANTPYRENQPGRTPVLDLYIRWTSRHQLSIKYPKTIVPSTGGGEHDGIYVQYDTY